MKVCDLCKGKSNDFKDFGVSHTWYIKTNTKGCDNLEVHLCQGCCSDLMNELGIDSEGVSTK